MPTATSAQKRTQKPKIPRVKPELEPWDEACKLRLTRWNELNKQPEALDPGVNFFVLALEEMGAQTHFSCEGHPHGFYICFSAPYEVAWKIAATLTFRVHIEPDHLHKPAYGKWSIRSWGGDMNQSRKRWVDPMHLQHLRYAAKKWVKELGVGKNKVHA